MKITFGQIVQLLESNSALATKLLTPATILGLLKVYSDFQAAGTLTTAEAFVLADEVLVVFETAGVTLGDLRALLASAKTLVVK